MLHLFTDGMSECAINEEFFNSTMTNLDFKIVSGLRGLSGLGKCTGQKFGFEKL